MSVRERVALFPGSFDPFTIGHEDIVRRGITLFDRVVVAVGTNTSKNALLTTEARIRLIQDLFSDTPVVDVVSYHGITTEFCRKQSIKFILRGLRTAADFEFERAIGQINRSMSPEIETVFLLTAPEYSAVSSSIVKEIFTLGGDAEQFMPKGIDIKKYL